MFNTANKNTIKYYCKLKLKSKENKKWQNTDKKVINSSIVPSVNDK